MIRELAGGTGTYSYLCFRCPLAIRLADRQEPLIDLRMVGCREIRYLRDGSREELYFVSFDERSEYAVNFRGGWRLQVAPHVEVKLGHPPAG